MLNLFIIRVRQYLKEIRNPYDTLIMFRMSYMRIEFNTRGIEAAVLVTAA